MTATLWCSCCIQCTSQRLMHSHESRLASMSEISPTHRSSPLATQQTPVNMSAASLDVSRWKASEVVLLDIGKFMQPPLESIKHTTLARECLRARTSATSLADACSPPARRSSQRRRDTTDKEPRAGLLCLALLFPGACDPRFCSRHCDFLPNERLSRVMLATVLMARC